METILNADNCSLINYGAKCFQNLTEEEIEIVQKSRVSVQFRKNENLTKEGAFASYILFIVNGLVKQHVEGGTNKNYNLRLIKSGEFVGLSAIFNNNIFEYSTIALTETQVFLIEKEIIRNLMKQNASFSYAIFQKYSEYTNRLFACIKSLSYKQMPGKLAETLIYLNDEKFKDENVFFNLSRKDIADFAGISTESAVKILKNFEKDNIITLSDKHITINQLSTLQEICLKG